MLLLLLACTGTTADTATLTGTCTAQVLIGFYDDDTCTPGTEVNELTFDLSQACHAWSRSTGAGGTRDNSVTRLQCYADRVCYTQHVETAACDSTSPTDKETRTDACLQEPTGEDLWSLILSGTEDCPVAPDDFACPVSGTGEGTGGLAVCDMP